MKILIICNSYSPNSDPRALRWTALSEEWAKRGIAVHVITGKPVGQAGQEIRNGVYVHRLGNGIFSGLRRWSTVPSSIVTARDKENQTPHPARVHTPNALSAALRKILRLIHDLTWKQVYWPDSTCLWILPAARYAIRLGRQHAVDALVTVSHPFSGHVVGLIAQHRLPRLTWLADSGDPFAFSKESATNNFWLWKRLNFWVERKLINAVDAFSVTTQETAELYKQYFPEGVNKLVVIPPLNQLSILDARAWAEGRPEGCEIVLLFVGVFYKNIRPPEPLLDLFEKLICNSKILKKSIKLHVIGPTGMVADVLHQYPDLQDKIVLLGKMPHTKAVKVMFSADCLVNVGNSTHYQLPSKLIEYMATGKPILNISSISNDSSSQVLQNYPASYNWALNKENDLDALCRFLETCRGQSIPVEQRESLVAPFSLSSVSAQYLTALSCRSEQADSAAYS
jgi:glycosyltransferase involved in cell wall biosynthesis